MSENQELAASKLHRWETYLEHFSLPQWEFIPDIGLYMEQVLGLIKGYLDYLPPELKEEQCITAAAINNYVRKKVMPEPVQKKYYRVHIAYLIMICTLKQSLSIAMLQTVVPYGMSEEEVRICYETFVQRHRKTCSFFIEEMVQIASVILGGEANDISVADSEELIITSAVISGFSRILAEKLILLKGSSES